MIYSLLGEGDRFSSYVGNAVAKNVANVMRFSDSMTVVCPFADDSWGYGPERLLVIPELRIYEKIRGRRRLPTWTTNAFFRHIYRPLLSRLKTDDIVWCHNQPNVSAALSEAIHRKGAKLVFHFHDWRNAYMAKSAFRSFGPDASVFVSDALRQDVLKIIPWLTNTYAVYNGVDPALFYPVPKNLAQRNPEPVILYVGRLHPEKGVHVLLEAMRLLQRRGIKVLCKVVGSSGVGGSKATSYVKMLQRSSPSNVQFDGYLCSKTVANAYRAANIVCCPSVCREAFGNVNVEAMACGIPVVASRVGGIPEIAADGGVLLVEPGSPSKLADALQSLIIDKQLRVDIGNQGQASYKKRFTWETIISQYQEIANSVVSMRSEEEIGRT